MAAEIGQPFGKTFLFLYAASYVFLLLSLLSGIYLSILNLQTFASIYLVMLALALAFMKGVEAERNTVTAFIAASAALFAIAAVSSLITTQWRIIGILTVAEYPAEKATHYPFTVKLGELAIVLGITPQTLLTLITNIPAPTAEECFFRIGIFSLLKPTLGETKSIIAQAIAFGLFHYYAYAMNTTAILTATLAGLALGFTYAKTNNQLAISLAHMFFNWTAILGGLR